MITELGNVHALLDRGARSSRWSLISPSTCAALERLVVMHQELLDLAHEAIVMTEDLDNDAARQWTRAARETVAKIERAAVSGGVEV